MLAFLIEILTEKPELIIACASLIIALIALGVSFWQGCLQYKHQKLSVVPNLDIDIDVDDRSLEKQSIIVRSNGLGPARLISYIWFVHDKEYKISDLSDFDHMLGVLSMSDDVIGFYIPRENEFLESGYKIALINYIKKTDENNEVINSNLKNAKALITYESIYGDKFVSEYDFS